MFKPELGPLLHLRLEVICSVVTKTVANVLKDGVFR